MTAGRGVLRARNQASKEVEFGVALDKIRKFVEWNGPACSLID
jgi:hypothetical protein